MTATDYCPACNAEADEPCRPGCLGEAVHTDSISVDCPGCDGAGEHGICPAGCDGSHVADTTRPCRTCDGTGSVTPAQVTDYANTHCAHGVHEDDPVGCQTCDRDTHTALPNADSNPWRSGHAIVAGGWDAEPPF